jgi:hypothetical protein
MEKNYIYIMLSRTPSKFAKVIRKAMQIEYNHASISLDEDLEFLYAFGRYKNCVPVVAGLVKEHASRFTLCKESDVQIKIYKLPVTQEQYEHVSGIIDQILADDEYQYNLFSALTFPVLKGFSTYKAYTCIEFVMYLLAEVGLELEKPVCSYHPQELEEILAGYEYYSGNLLEYREFEQNPEHEFFEKSKRITAWKATAVVLSILIYRNISGFLAAFIQKI